MPDAKPPQAAPAETGLSPVAGSPGISSIGTGMPSSSTPGKRSTFNADELAIVLSHYNLGVIEALKEFPRGSRKAPKLRIKARHGDYLLKRRARGKDDPYKVAFCHAIQLHLAARQFPLPHLVGTRDTNNSMLQWNGATYELFEYLRGTGYDQSLDATAEAGKTLALFHKLLRDFHSDYSSSRGTYHHNEAVISAAARLPTTLARTEPRADNAKHLATGKWLGEQYRLAVEHCEKEGLGGWPLQVTHSDWHPGNMLFRGSRVVAVIDYDAARLAPRVTDIANGALQFSMIGGGEDTGQWPAAVDGSRFKRFLRAYDSVPEAVLTKAELRVIPWLMIEALIAESVIPIAATGQFSRMDGGPFLNMVVRKVTWLRENAAKLTSMVE